MGASEVWSCQTRVPEEAAATSMLTFPLCPQVKAWVVTPASKC